MTRNPETAQLVSIQLRLDLIEMEMSVYAFCINNFDAAANDRKQVRALVTISVFRIMSFCDAPMTPGGALTMTSAEQLRKIHGDDEGYSWPFSNSCVSFLRIFEIGDRLCKMIGAPPTAKGRSVAKTP